jgi:hypothetical protein
MKDEVSSQVWSVDVAGQVYEATFEDLAQWIGEGALHAGDLVRKGNLRWIEAGKVPQLTPYFTAKAAGSPIASRVDALIAETPAEIVLDHRVGNIHSDADNDQRVSGFSSFTNGTDGCQIHAGEIAAYLCSQCGGGFCKACPRTYGGVKICPSCGGLCTKRDEVQHAVGRDTEISTHIEEGFGGKDFVRALTHPFKFRSSLVFGALMFMFFSLGQSASSIGGIFMFSASISCLMLKNMLTFGVLANTIDNFSQGNIRANFMPDFDDFSLWDDVVHPFFLSIGAYISSFGVFALIVVFGMYFVVSSINSTKESIRGDIERIPGSNYYDTQRPVQQSEKVKDLLGNVQRQNAQRLEQQDAIANGEPPSISTAPEDTEDSVMKANELIQQNRKAQLEAIAGKTAEEKRSETAEMIKSFMTLAAPIVVLAFISLIWGLFYFPAACAVAGYTRSFTATLNPMVGLDTIRRLGFDYVKILGMLLLVAIGSTFAGIILNVIFSPLDLPGFGNLPANAISSLFMFYSSIVFSCILGLALFKNSARLKLLR